MYRAPSLYAASLLTVTSRCARPGLWPLKEGQSIHKHTYIHNFVGSVPDHVSMFMLWSYISLIRGFSGFSVHHPDLLCHSVLSDIATHMRRTSFWTSQTSKR